MRLVRIFGIVLVVALVGGAAVWGVSRLVHRWQAERDRVEAAQAPQGRLPEGVRPIRYSLALRVDPDADRFSGRVAIDIETESAREAIFLHGEGIDPTRVRERLADGGERALEYREMGRSGVVRLLAEDGFAPGRSTIEIDYEAPFDETLAALYVVRAGDRRYAFTQFEAIDARHVFPGFDEPRFKVPFDLALEVRAGHEAFATTPERLRRDLGDGFTRIEFEPTPPLPTYLLAFAVGPLDVVEGPAIPPTAERARPIPLRGIATAGKGEGLGFALERTAELVLALEDYFGIPYPYAKLDLVAVPDFSFGAMENVGLITYREPLLLLGDHPSVRDLRRFTNIHAHELAHQWFGNLVTMPWWDDIWLNESFATWMGNRVSHVVRPDLEFDRETTRNGHRVMEMDVYTDSRRVREEVAGREEIATSFDWISYAKGGAFLSMLEQWLGPARFRAGVRRHIERHAGGTADLADFVASLTASNPDAPIEAVARSFLTQRGVPDVGVDWRCVEGRTRITLTQSRYVEFGSSIDPEQRWTQPLCLQLLDEASTDAGDPVCTVIEDAVATLDIDRPVCPAIVLPNAGGAGYTRWHLDDAHWASLVERIDAFDAGAKLSIASNLAAAFRAGRISAARYLELVPGVIRQPEWDVATQPIGTLRFLSEYVATPEERRRLAEYVLALYAPHLAPSEASASGGGDESTSARLLRSSVLWLLAIDLEEPDEQARLAAFGRAAIGFGRDGVLDLSVVEGDLLSVALAAALRVEGRPFFDALRASIEASSDFSFRAKALSAIASVEDPELAADVRSLRFLLSLNLNEMPMVIGAQAARRANLPALFGFVERFFPLARGFMPEAYLSRAPQMASGFCSGEAHGRVEAVFAPWVDEIPGLGRSLSQTLERIRLCEALVAAQPGLAVPASGPRALTAR